MERVDGVFMRDDFKVTLSQKTGVFAAFRVQAYDQRDAVSQTLKYVFGYRSAYLRNSRAIARIDRHGRVRNILRKNVSVEIERREE